MEPATYISLEAICEGYQIERDFALSLQDFGLIEFHIKQKIVHLHCDELPRLEKIMRLQQDLYINLDGIGVILDLLDKLENQENELRILKNKVYLYEANE